MRSLLALLLQAALAASPAPSTAPSPTIDQLVELRRVTSVALSPDGTLVAYAVRETNWDDNAYETEIWLADAASGEPRQLTDARRSPPTRRPSRPTASALAFVSDRGDKRQVYLIDLRGGEAEALTSGEEGVPGIRLVARRQADRLHGARPEDARR